MDPRERGSGPGPLFWDPAAEASEGGTHIPGCVFILTIPKKCGGELDLVDSWPLGETGTDISLPTHVRLQAVLLLDLPWDALVLLSLFSSLQAWLKHLSILPRVSVSLHQAQSLTPKKLSQDGVV